MTQEPGNNAQLVKDFLNAIWIENDPDKAMTFVADNVAYIGPRLQFDGKAQYKSMVEHYRTIFDDVTIEFHDFVSENNMVFFRATFSGIHKGEYEGIAPTYKRLKFLLFNQLEIQDGKIIRDWDIFDEIGLMKQLGMELVHQEPAH